VNAGINQAGEDAQGAAAEPMTVKEIVEEFAVFQ